MQNHPSARLLAEFVGTFVFVGAGAAAVVGTGAGPNEIAAIAFAHGLAIMVFAFAFGNLSGAVSSTHDGFGVIIPPRSRRAAPSKSRLLQVVLGLCGSTPRR